MEVNGAHELPGWLLGPWAWHRSRASVSATARFATSSTAFNFRCTAFIFRARRVAAGPMVLASAEAGVEGGVGMDAGTVGCE